MKLMILGAGFNQCHAINKIKEMGYIAVAADNREDSPGKKLAAISCLASTFSYEESLACAKKEAVDGIYTTGTDQPVYIAARVAKTLHLPSNLGVEEALLVTNKLQMKRRLAQCNLPAVSYQVVNQNTQPQDCDVAFPAVLKPVDSQGQRGIFYLESREQLPTLIGESLRYSRQKDALLETYYHSDEICVSAWVHKSESKVLSVTDRVRFSDKSHLGICQAHEYPSRHLSVLEPELTRLTQEVAWGFGLREGPLYVQFLWGEQGLKINELAARIGGAYEDVYLERCMNLDLASMQIEDALGLLHHHRGWRAYQRPATLHMSVELFFAQPGVIRTHNELAELKSLPGMVDVQIQVEIGDRVQELHTASQRIGYAIIRGKSKQEWEQRVSLFYRTLYLKDDLGKNLVYQREVKSVEGNGCK